jgi:hypothetical protein
MDYQSRPQTAALRSQISLSESLIDLNVALSTYRNEIKKLMRNPLRAPAYAVVMRESNSLSSGSLICRFIKCSQHNPQLLALYKFVGVTYSRIANHWQASR